MDKRRDPSVPDTDDGEGFLSRWSRRKQESRAPTVTMPTVSTQTPAPVPMKAESPVPVTDADLPPLESLDENSDFSAFLSPGVSEALRRRALRKLFAGAKFQVRDGLDDYDEDYRNFESLGDTLTANMRYRAQVEAERLARASAADEDQPRQSGPEQHQSAASDPGPDDTTAAQRSDEPTGPPRA